VIFFRPGDAMKMKRLDIPSHVKKLWRGKNMGKCTISEGKPHNCRRKKSERNNIGHRLAVQVDVPNDLKSAFFAWCPIQ
jgi:hypothetical protein